MRIINKERGDTLTEVMFATAVAALVIVLALAAMNRSFFLYTNGVRKYAC